MTAATNQGAMPGFTPFQPPPNVFYGFLDPKLWDVPKDAGYLQFSSDQAVGIAAATTKDLVSQNPAENGFLITAWTALVLDQATQLVVAATFPGLVVIKDSVNQELGNAPMPFLNIFGTAQLPAILQWQKWVNPASKITISINNPTAAAVAVHVTAWGFKVYPRGKS
jgi:hypothetical protein